MQRSHERDLIGHILAKEFNGMHICLPAEFEPNHPYTFLNSKWPVPRRTDSSNGTDGGPKLGEPWYDFRKQGEPLWKVRFPAAVLKTWTSSLTRDLDFESYQSRRSRTTPAAPDGPRGWTIQTPLVR